MDVIREFFGAIPGALTLFWEFIEGFYGIAILLGSVALGAGLAFGALRLRDRSGWLSAILGTMAATVALWWVFGVVPSAWVYYFNEAQDVVGGAIVPNALPGFANFYFVFRDAVVLALTGLGLALVVVASLWLQKRYPRALAEGEEARPQAGGYK